MQSIHTGVLSILVSFKGCVFLERKTLQEPLSVQVELNRVIKEGVEFKIFIAEINDKQQEETHHNFSNYSYHASLSPCGSIGKLWGKYSSYFDTEMWNI